MIVSGKDAMEQHPTIKTLAGKMAKILGEVSRIPKSGRNMFQNYDYATEADVLDAIRPLLSKYNVALFFDCVDVEELDNNRTRVRVQIELVCGDSGEARSSFAFGEARDADRNGKTQDKGIYKAITGAMKYWMFKTFLISTGDDPEEVQPAQRQNTQLKAVPPAKGKPPSSAPAPTASTAAPSFVDQAKEIAAHGKANGLTSEKLTALCKSGQLPTSPSKFTTKAQVTTFSELVQNAIAALPTSFEAAGPDYEGDVVSAAG